METAEKSYGKALKISSQVLEFAKSIVEPGVKILEIAEKIEEKIDEMGAKPAFPVNVCINEITAHYTPGFNDPTLVKEDDMVKIDIGLHVNGYIADNAFTVFVGRGSHELIKTAEKAVEEANKLVRVGRKVREISSVIDEIVSSRGFNVVRNLTGHGLDRYNLHATPSIPNVKNESEAVLEAGKAIAIEVFVTDGSGWVKESAPVLIYQYSSDKPIRMAEGRKILIRAKRDFHTLPFAKRWIKDIPLLRLELALRQLAEMGALHEHPILREEHGTLVAQYEKTVLVK